MIMQKTSIFNLSGKVEILHLLYIVFSIPSFKTFNNMCNLPLFGLVILSLPKL